MYVDRRWIEYGSNVIIIRRHFLITINLIELEFQF